MTRSRARLVTLLGVLVAVAGLAGFWLTNDVDRKTLTADQRRVLGLDEDDFHVSFVVAGLDMNYIVTEAEPVFEELPGWTETTAGVTEYDKLPVNARRYLERIAEVCDVAIDMISTGPDRMETIMLNQSFKV